MMENMFFSKVVTSPLSRLLFINSLEQNIYNSIFLSLLCNIQCSSLQQQFIYLVSFNSEVTFLSIYYSKKKSIQDIYKSSSQIEPLIFLFIVPIAVRINLTFDISLDASNNFLILYCGIRLQPTIFIPTIFPLIVVCIL